MAAAPGTQPPSELDEEQLDQLIEEYKKMKASGHLDSLDDDFENHPFFMDHLPTVRAVAFHVLVPRPGHSLDRACCAGGGL